jgi:hypothetical protein
MSMSVLYVHVHAAYPCLYCMPMSMLNVHAVFLCSMFMSPYCMSMLFVYFYAMCPCCMSMSPCCMSMSPCCMSCLHAACPCPCCKSISMLNAHVRAAVYDQAACPCLCCMSVPILHVHVHSACLCYISILHVPAADFPR